MEELHGFIGDNQREPAQVATEIVNSLKSQKSYNQMLSEQDRFDTFVALFSSAIEAYRQGTIKSVGDFQIKRDAICEACGVGSCWRKDDTVTLEQAIIQLRNGRRLR